MTDDRFTAREMELAAAALPPPVHAPRAPRGEVSAMLARRGYVAEAYELDLPFPREVDGERADRIAEALGHYAFRLFLRGAIQARGAFAPDEATKFLTPEQSRSLAEGLESLGLASRLDDGRYRLVHPPHSFGGTLEWYVARELERRYGFEVAVGVKFRASGVGGDLDVVAAAEGKLIYLELKSSPPKHLSPEEVGAFFDRVRALRPHVAIFAVDTALRLSDKVLPMLADAVRERNPAAAPPRNVERELWALSNHVYAVNARPDLVANVGRAIAEGIFALSPVPF